MEKKTAKEAAGAVGLTALVGQKGANYSACLPPFEHGSNVLSVAFDPSKLTAFAAWEDGAGFGTAAGNWRPAACNPYLQIDLASWFSGQNLTEPPRPVEQDTTTASV